MTEASEPMKQPGVHPPKPGHDEEIAEPPRPSGPTGDPDRPAEPPAGTPAPEPPEPGLPRV